MDKKCLINAIQVFQKYVDSFAGKDDMVGFKYKHTINVMALSLEIAKSLFLDEKETLLVQLIALLHDIGRFNQVKEFKDFRENENFNHASYGLKLLFDDKLIREFIYTKQYDEIIYFAIKNHSTYYIADSSNERNIFVTKILRDADKLENLITNSKIGYAQLIEICNLKVDDEISESIMKGYQEHRMIFSRERKSTMDIYFSVIAYIFDLNFDYSFQYIKEYNLINKLFENIGEQKTINEKKLNFLKSEITNFVNYKTEKVTMLLS